MRRLWCLIGVLATLQFHSGEVLAQARARDPLVYYQLLYLSFLTRSACGDDVHGWWDDLHAIREILMSDLGHNDQDLSAIESRAGDLQQTIPCSGETRRDLLAVTMGEPQRALGWFKTLKTARNP
jgi:hypothetical protein